MSEAASRKLIVAGLAATCALSGAGMIALHHIRRRQMYEAQERMYDSDEEPSDHEGSDEAAEMVQQGRMLLEDGDGAGENEGAMEGVGAEAGEEEGESAVGEGRTKKRSRAESEDETEGGPSSRKRRTTEAFEGAAARTPLVPSIPSSTSSIPPQEPAPSSASTKPIQSARRLELEKAYEDALFHARRHSEELTTTITTALDGLTDSIVDTLATRVSPEDQTPIPPMPQALRNLCDAITLNIPGRPLVNTDALTVAIKRMGTKVAEGIHGLADEEDRDLRVAAVKHMTADLEFKVNYKDFELEEVFDRLRSRRGKSLKSGWDSERSKQHPMSRTKPSR